MLDSNVTSHHEEATQVYGQSLAATKQAHKTNKRWEIGLEVFLLFSSFIDNAIYFNLWRNFWTKGLSQPYANNDIKHPSDPVSCKSFLWNLTCQVNPLGEEYMSPLKGQRLYRCWWWDPEFT